MRKYAGKIDRTRVAFAGGCRGAVKLVKVFARGPLQGIKYQVKTIVALSISGKDEELIKAFQAPHHRCWRFTPPGTGMVMPG